MKELTSGFTDEQLTDMKNVQVTLMLTEAEYAVLLAAMRDAGVSCLESFVYSVLVQRQDD